MTRHALNKKLSNRIVVKLNFLWKARHHVPVVKANANTFFLAAEEVRPGNKCVVAFLDGMVQVVMNCGSCFAVQKWIEEK